TADRLTAKDPLCISLRSPDGAAGSMVLGLAATLPSPVAFVAENSSNWHWPAPSVPRSSRSKEWRRLATADVQRARAPISYKRLTQTYAKGVGTRTAPTGECPEQHDEPGLVAASDRRG